MSYEETGILTSTELHEIFPPKERFEKGPVAIVECLQRIPCDPCVTACKLGAIKKEFLSDLPKIDYDKCIGCGACVAACPGLAIFVLQLNYKKDESLLIIPYERLPKPKKGETFEALNRSGAAVGEAKIVSARETKNRTQVISFTIDKKHALNAREIGGKIYGKQE